MQRIRPGQKLYTPSGPPETGFNRVIKQYDDYILSLQRDVGIYRIVALFCLFLVGISVFGWFQTIHLRRTVPVVIEVNEFGTPRYLGRADNLSFKKYEPKEYMYKAHIVNFITSTREIILDNDVMVRNMQKAFAGVSKDLRIRLKNEIMSADPFKKVGQIRLTIQVESVIKTTNKTWQADWYEIQSSMTGQELSRDKYRGLFTIVQQEPEDEKQEEMNPLSMYIVDYNITALKRVE